MFKTVGTISSSVGGLARRDSKREKGEEGMTWKRGGEREREKICEIFRRRPSLPPPLPPSLSLHSPLPPPPHSGRAGGVGAPLYIDPLGGLGRWLRVQCGSRARRRSTGGELISPSLPVYYILPTLCTIYIVYKRTEGEGTWGI